MAVWSSHFTVAMAVLDDVDFFPPPELGVLLILLVVVVIADVLRGYGSTRLVSKPPTWRFVGPAMQIQMHGPWARSIWY